VFEDICGFSEDYIIDVFRERDFIRLVKWNVPVNGWLTPDGICINLHALPDARKTKLFGLIVVVGKVCCQYLSRLSHSNLIRALLEKRDERADSVFNMRVI
jgi:hypothetical protein